MPCMSSSHGVMKRSGSHTPIRQRYQSTRVVSRIPPAAVAAAPAHERRPMRAGNAERIEKRNGTSTHANTMERVSTVEEKIRSFGIIPAGNASVKALWVAISAPSTWKTMAAMRAARLRTISPETSTIIVMALGRVCVEGIFSRSAVTSHQVKPRPRRRGEITHANVVRSAAKEYTPITTRADISAYLEGGAGACLARAVRRREVVR